MISFLFSYNIENVRKYSSEIADRGLFFSLPLVKGTILVRSDYSWSINIFKFLYSLHNPAQLTKVITGFWGFGVLGF